MLVVGLTGDIGAGKSTVSRIWENCGASRIDADVLVHDLWTKREVLDSAISRWGASILMDNGTVNRGAIAARTFTDENEYEWLCNLLHPLVRSAMERRVSQSSGWIVAEIPLLFENGVPSWVDMTVYVTSDREIRGKRNKFRGLGEEKLIQRERFLQDAKEKRELADLVIRNDGDIDELRNILKSHTDEMKDMASIIEVSLSCSFKKTARELACSIMRANLAANATFLPVETSFSGFEDYITHRWKISFYSLDRLFRKILKKSREVMKKETSQITATEIRRAELGFRKKIVEACRN